tara:strand:+ start:432 stop:857 length:426 start_codon:yes stop_codon:yes gene_type:complete
MTEETEDENPDVLREAILEALDNEGADYVAECFLHGAIGLEDLDPIANKARGDMIGCYCVNCKKEYPDDSDFVPIRSSVDTTWPVIIEDMSEDRLFPENPGASREPKIMYVCEKCALDIPDSIPEEQLRLDDPSFDGHEFG